MHCKFPPKTILLFCYVLNKFLMIDSVNFDQVHRKVFKSGVANLVASSGANKY